MVPLVILYLHTPGVRVPNQERDRDKRGRADEGRNRRKEKVRLGVQLSGIALTQHVQGPRLEPQHHQRGKQNKWKNKTKQNKKGKGEGKEEGEGGGRKSLP